MPYFGASFSSIARPPSSFLSQLEYDVCYSRGNNSAGMVLQYCGSAGTGVCMDGRCLMGDVCVEDTETKIRRCVTEKEYFSVFGDKGQPDAEPGAASTTSSVAGIKPKRKEKLICGGTTSPNVTECIPETTELSLVQKVVAGIGFSTAAWMGFIGVWFFRDKHLPNVTDNEQMALQEALDRHKKTDRFKKHRWWVSGKGKHDRRMDMKEDVYGGDEFLNTRDRSSSSGSARLSGSEHARGRGRSKSGGKRKKSGKKSKGKKKGKKDKGKRRRKSGGGKNSPTGRGAEDSDTDIDMDFSDGGMDDIDGNELLGDVTSPSTTKAKRASSSPSSPGNRGGKKGKKSKAKGSKRKAK
mmetsp:Transcript_1992/g.4618  ORF Transcript_1992/g.4618 Transcript_1992/m.4618 type:complete len:353 (+) Transcript_1992:105-1163(+)|eukprot:CAMPEP_0178999294 /NCGR_PEP_ID=MMETSP0795-20121207/9970_1 /TAXON_ID=88552 /ORGANISM="Amoebophrya sp., Strain Ameob2" /LENGTH=352 /DNA_ID=CAMNT_0020692031 /DNA_START=14 /DNA_END=1072 /DNA_ORIENTATION=+